MAVTNARTREQIRKSVGYRIGAMRDATMTSAGSTTTGVDSEIGSANDAVAGKHIIFTSGNNDGSIRTIDTYVGSTFTWTIRGDAVTSTADGDTYEVWDEDMPPARTHSFIDDAVGTITRKGAPPVTDFSIHGYRDRRSFDIPTSVVGIQHVSYRSNVSNVQLHSCDSAWDELTDTDVTIAADDEDYAQGTGANRFEVADAISNGDIIATDDISSEDISKYDYIEFWAKSSIATAAGDLQLLLDDTPSCASPVETLSFPALTADTWTFCRVALANPELDTAIISVGVKYNDNDPYAEATGYLWIDDIRAVVEDSANWQLLSRAHWDRDKDRRELILTDMGFWTVGYRLVRLQGVKKPTQLTADATTADVEAEYVINLASAWLMRSRMNRYGANREAAVKEADRLEARAERWLAQQRVPNGAIWVDD